MKNTKKFMLSIMSLLLVIFLFIGGSVPVKADDAQPDDGSHMWHETEADVALVPGFYCLHPHKSTPTPYDPVHMIGTPSTEYNGYSQDTLKQVAAAVILRGEYYRETEKFVDDGSLQSVIWAIVCKRSECIMREGGNLHLNGRDLAKEYYAYVMANYSSLSEDDYTMTIWVSTKPDYQDILEARLVEKHGVPSVEKKVMDTNDTDNTGDAATGWQDSADYDIGDTIPFQITATLRDMPNFNNYYLEFVDHMEHMTIVPGSIKVELDGKPVTDSFTIEKKTEGYSTDLSIKCENILPLGAADGSNVVVTYQATLNEDAKIGSEGNPNDVYLVYTRSSGTADKGETPKDRVKVFTYLMVVDKVDSEGTKLQGAAFKLSKKQADGTFKTVAVIGAEENADGSYTLTDGNLDRFEWKGIDDGTYKLEEVVTPRGYNTIEPIEFWVKATHDPSSEDSRLDNVNSNYAGFDGFIPAEYLEQFEITIPNAEGYYGIQTGELTTKITNISGAVLPTTGGMGTKIIYIAGALMVLAAGVLLVARRRVNSR